MVTSLMFCWIGEAWRRTGGVLNPKLLMVADTSAEVEVADIAIVGAPFAR